VVLNLRTCLDLRLSDDLLLSLIAEKHWGDHRLDDCPVLGPLGCPLVEHLRAGRCELSNLIGGKRLPQQRGQCPLNPHSSLLSGNCTTGITLSAAACAVTVCAIITATTPSSWPSAGTGTWASSTIGALCADSSATPSTPAPRGPGTRVSASAWLAGRSCHPHQILPPRPAGRRYPRQSDRPRLQRPGGRRCLRRPGWPPPQRQPGWLLACHSGRRHLRFPVLEPVGPPEPLEPWPPAASRPPPRCPRQAGAAVPSAMWLAPRSLATAP